MLLNLSDIVSRGELEANLDFRFQWTISDWAIAPD